MRKFVPNGEIAHHPPPKGIQSDKALLGDSYTIEPSAGGQSNGNRLIAKLWKKPERSLQPLDQLRARDAGHRCCKNQASHGWMLQYARSLVCGIYGLRSGNIVTQMLLRFRVSPFLRLS